MGPLKRYRDIALVILLSGMAGSPAGIESLGPSNGRLDL